MIGRRSRAVLLGAAMAVAGAVSTGSATSATDGPYGDGLPVLAEQMRYRAELGLRADEEYVTDLNERFAAGEVPGGSDEGAVFTAEEESELDAREAAADAIARAARAYFTGQRADAFGGVYIDHATGDTVVLVTRDAATFTTTLRGLVDDDDRLSVRTVRYALVDLEAVAARITAAYDRFAAAGAAFSFVGADERGNVVEVGVADDTPEVRGTIIREAQVPDLGMLVFRESPPAIWIGTEGLNAPPLKGGQRTTQYATDGGAGRGGRCTSGFVSYDRHRTDALIYVTDYYLLTAGHCGEPGWAFFQSDLYVIGTADRSRFMTGGTDALRIPVKPSDRSNLVAITATRDRFIYARQANTADKVGERTCMSGATTGGELCGTLLHRAMTVTGPDGVRISAQRIASFQAQPGDSGGSILLDSEARGITSCIVLYKNRMRTCYSHVHTALQQLGLTDVVGVGST